MFLQKILTAFSSRGYRPLVNIDSLDSEEATLAWKSPASVERQWRLVESQLRDYRSGRANILFDSFNDMVRAALGDGKGSTLLEIGCSSGYYSEVLKAKNIHATYSGVDFSDVFIKKALSLFKEGTFYVGDATCLDFDDASFDFVASGCCILHIGQYERAIFEAARVSRKWVLFHRTPILEMTPTTTFLKKAYGSSTLEIHFNESELFNCFYRAGLAVVMSRTLAKPHAQWRGESPTTKSYLCVKL